MGRRRRAMPPTARPNMPHMLQVTVRRARLLTRKLRVPIKLQMTTMTRKREMTAMTRNTLPTARLQSQLMARPKMRTATLLPALQVAIMAMVMVMALVLVKKLMEDMEMKAMAPMHMEKGMKGTTMAIQGMAGTAMEKIMESMVMEIMATLRQSMLNRMVIIATAAMAMDIQRVLTLLLLASLPLSCSCP